MINVMSSVETRIIKEFEVDGQKFWIQYAQEFQWQTIIDAMAYEFIRDNPVFKRLFSEKPPSSSFIEEIKTSYNQILQSGLSIVCMTKENDLPVVTGFQCFEINVTDRMTIDFRIGEKSLRYMLSFTSLCEELNTPTYLVDRGLFVFPNYRRKGIACSLLECWKLVCKHAGQEVAMGTFSSIYSQAAAKKAGLTEIEYRLYEDIRKDVSSGMSIPLGIENHTEGFSLFIVYP